MRRRLTLFVLMFVAVPAFAQATAKPDDILAQENLFWTSYTAGDVTALSSQLHPDFTSVGQLILNRNQLLNFVKAFHTKCTLAPVKVLDPQIGFIAPEVATIVYHAVETPTCGDKSMSGTLNISTVWVLRDGKWQMRLHTEYAVASLN